LVVERRVDRGFALSISLLHGNGGESLLSSSSAVRGVSVSECAGGVPYQSGGLQEDCGAGSETAEEQFTFIVAGGGILCHAEGNESKDDC